VKLIAGPHAINFTGGASSVTFGQSAGTYTATNMNWSIAGTKTVELTTLAATSLVTAGRTMTVNGTFQIDQGASPGTAGTWSYSASGKLVFNNTSGLTVNGTDVYWPSASGPPNVTVQNGGGVTL